MYVNINIPLYTKLCMVHRTSQQKVNMKPFMNLILNMYFE